MADEGVVHIGKRCYVGNLSYSTSWQDLKDKFRECGNVAYANVMRDDNGRSKGWGIVEFVTPQEALQAIETLNGTELGGRKIMVREDREDRDVKQQYTKPTTATRGGRGRRGARGRGGQQPETEEEGQSSGLQVVVQGIPWKYTAEDLQTMFGEIGELETAEVIYGGDGRSRGFGTVRFSSTTAAQNAILRYHAQALDGRTLTVRLDKYA